MILLQLLLLPKNWSHPGAGQVSIPLVSTNGADSILESDILTSYVMAASMRFTIVVMAICVALVMMLLKIGMNSIELVVDVFGSISNDKRQLLNIQQLMTIWYQNRFLYSFP